MCRVVKDQTLQALRAEPSGCRKSKVESDQGSECTLPDENADRSLMSARVMQAKDSKRGPSVCCCHKLSRVCILFGASLPFDPSVGMVEVPS